ncbi:hypothetical protein JXL21_13175 [Candidatus Bathyarchaeota archaeon]|nr:hypothetical protein [Candidatus Bathyarchaeota archaeon]
MPLTYIRDEDTPEDEFRRKIKRFNEAMERYKQLQAREKKLMERLDQLTLLAAESR